MEFKRKYSEKNIYDRFSLDNNLQDNVHELYQVNLPDHFTFTYEVVVWTDLIGESNQIIDRISYASEDYWGDKEDSSFRTISDFNLQTEVTNDEDRMVKSTFNIQVYAYLLLNTKSSGNKQHRKHSLIVGWYLELYLESSDLKFPTADDNKGYSGQGIYNTPISDEEITIPEDTYPS